MSLTNSKPSYEASCDGYIVVAPLAPEVQQAIAGLQESLAGRFSEDAFWFPTDDQLHITVAHVLSPEVTYDEPSPQLFSRIGQQAMQALDIAVRDTPQPTVVFDSIVAFADAIIVKGHDSGELDAIRASFVDNFSLPETTRRPPTIIHSTIARYRQPLDLEAVQDFVSTLSMTASSPISHIDLVHERKIFMQEYDLIQSYNISSPVAA